MCTCTYNADKGHTHTHRAEKDVKKLFWSNNQFVTHLHTKGHHHKQPHPTVQGVEVGFVRQVVRIEHSLEPHCGEDEGHGVHTSMQDLDVDLLVIAEHSVGQNS